MYVRSSPEKQREQWRQLLEQVYAKNRRWLYQYASALIRDPETAQDLVQSLFLDLLDCPPQLSTQTENALLRYITASIKNRALNLYRDRKNRQTVSLDAPGKEGHAILDLLCEIQPSLLDQLITQETYVQLQKAILRLSPKQAKYLDFRYIRGMSHRQIAQAMNTTEEASRSLGHRTLKKLRALFLKPGKL